jgi:hypothetical protein
MSKSAHPRGIAGLLKRINIEHIWALAVIIGVFAFVSTHPIRPHDFWWHMALGREILDSGHIPDVDTFSYTATGRPYPSYQAFWLMDVILYQVYMAGGAELIVFFHSIAITTAYAALMWLGHRLAGSWRTAALSTLFSAALGLNDFNVRPQAIAFPIAAVFMLAMHQYDATHRRGWLVVFPVGMLIWVNSHGTFPLGLLLISLWLVNSFWRAFVSGGRSARAAVAPGVALVMAALASLLNPRGISTFSYVSGMSSNPTIQNMVPEWAPPAFTTLTGQLFLTGLLAVATLLAISPKRPSPFQLLSFIAFAGLGLRTTRGAIWFGLVMDPVLADHTAALTRETRRWLYQKRGALPRSNSRGNPILNLAMIAILCLGGLISLPWLKHKLPLPPQKAGVISSETPLAATEHLLAARLPGPVFHAMSFGSYLIWQAQPDYPVFVDSRIELYTPKTWYDYINISSAADNWESLLNKYGIKTLMLGTGEQPALIEATLKSPNWEAIYSDDSAVILTERQTN